MSVLAALMTLPSPSLLAAECLNGSRPLQQEGVGGGGEEVAMMESVETGLIFKEGRLP